VGYKLTDIFFAKIIVDIFICAVYFIPKNIGFNGYLRRLS
jgi:hypothetical protein